jgi:hypothetical protein
MATVLDGSGQFFPDFRRFVIMARGKLGLMAREFADDADAKEAILADLEHLGLDAAERSAAARRSNR